MPLKPTQQDILNTKDRYSNDEDSLSTLIDVETLQSIMNDFHQLTGMTTAILDMKGNIVEATGWQDICAKFHRIHPETAKKCAESDFRLVQDIKPGEYREYQCQNGLWDVVTPLYIENKHMGNIYTGQFFYDDDIVDQTRFIQQAQKYGFDKDEYMAALNRIPRYSREKIKHLMQFLVKLTSYISNISYAKKKLDKVIQEQKRMEHSLRESERFQRALLQTIPDFIWLKDQNGVFLSCNAMFERILNAKEEQILGKTDYDFVDKIIADQFREHDRKAMAAGKPSSNEECVTLADTGEKVLLETVKTPMIDEQGRCIGVLGIARNITERKKADDEKTELRNQLQQAQKMESVGRLAGGVAHDFNNMLGVIIGFSELGLVQTIEGSQLHHALQQIMTAAKRSADITRQLLAFARKQTVSPIVLDINSTVKGMTHMLSRFIGEDIDLVWQADQTVWPVKMDPGQLDQIMVNLCVNARDAIEDIGKITIETANVIIDETYCNHHYYFLPGDFVLLAVSDNGCGMDHETLKNIFEPFFTTKEATKGTGLGLSTVYGIVKQNNGFINVYSEVGFGTTFKIYLPRHCETMQIEPDNSPEIALEFGQETILIVEDESIILEMATLMLQSFGYNVVVAGTPSEAIRRVKQHHGKIDLLLTDVVLPEMNGKDLARHLRKIYPNLKCLFMSGYTANVIAHHGVLDEGVNFIQKPFQRVELGAKIKEALGKDNSKQLTDHKRDPSL
ncbi:PocR ligand-binding domain-containing protein [uncultured Desulfobacter sp.]|uniref:PocR ligand-binding domain-containing protein n=1 Tax=uncultured Desulfobacter sp. TaxID=240139 RepID=UPI002AAA67B4|nr:PocR ligand-binding domain-containing protein [uncultured Desulfobacter sp.]